MNTVMIWQIDSTSSADTEKLGACLGAQLKGGEVIELAADLGGGKTTFVRGLATGLGSRDTVASPTFVLNKIYTGHDDLKLYHYDFYRLRQPGIVADQLAEALQDPKVVTVVEWAKVVKNVLPAEHWRVKFELVKADPDQRRITVEYPESGLQVIRAAESNWGAI